MCSIIIYNLIKIDYFHVKMAFSFRIKLYKFPFSIQNMEKQLNSSLITELGFRMLRYGKIQNNQSAMNIAPLRTFSLNLSHLHHCALCHP